MKLSYLKYYLLCLKVLNNLMCKHEMLKLLDFHILFFSLPYRQFYIYNNSVSIGLKPAEGLMSPKISITDFHKEKLQFRMFPLDENCLLTSQKLAAIGSKSSIKEVS